MEYAELVIRVSKLLRQSPLGLSLIEKTISGNFDNIGDLPQLYALRELLVQSQLCDREGNIINYQKLETFVNHLQGAMWAYEDSDNLAPSLQLVMTIPNWLNYEQIRHTEHVFRDLIYSAQKDIWIVNSFFSIHSLEVLTLVDLIALRLQQSDVFVRLLVREAEPGGKEMVLPLLRRLCGLLTNHQLQRLQAYCLDFKQDTYGKTLHAKIIVRDGLEAYVGSANWTKNSLKNSIELGLLVEGVIVREQLMPILKTLEQYSEPILLEML